MIRSPRLASIVSFLCVLLAVPGLALAAEEVAQDLPLWKEILGQLIPVVGAVVLAFAGLALKKLQEKYGLEVDDKADALVRRTLRGLIIGAEEWSAREMKTGLKPDGAQKLKKVLDLAAGLYPKLADSELRGLVDEELARVPGVGATGHGHVAPKVQDEKDLDLSASDVPEEPSDEAEEAAAEA